MPDPLVPEKPVALQFDIADKANAFLIGRESLPLNDIEPRLSGDCSWPTTSWAIRGRRRLFERLRQKEGLSYGVGTSSSSPTRSRPTAARRLRDLAPENLERCARGFAEEFASALKDGFTDAEVKHGQGRR